MLRLPSQVGSVCRRTIFLSSTCSAKPAKASKMIKTALIEEPEPVRDTTILQQFCCGLNYMEEGEDTPLKDDSEYPEWLWTVHTGKPKTFNDYDPSTREYWYALEKAQQAHQDQIEAGKTFYQRPKDEDLRFFSRLPPKRK